ncbi:hypothetical protein FJT64_027679 [Amphibalanus amphitrite]|uniref:C-type lectin domain-containing protein n=1 Tax=Amphibalanus amphitrite TaxID=1232801 RepID=A0A6A4WCI5_AMPAM|nr:hypothetical protein FJT64_027679 [Amphibalanus amphitrite]
MMRALALLAVVAAAAAQDGGRRDLILPDPKACANRVKHAHEFRNGHYYFYSWRHRATSRPRARLAGRAQHLPQALPGPGLARDRPGEQDGRVGHRRRQRQPKLINGWFWSGSGEKMPPSNQRSGGYPNWSNTGGSKKPQPDNREHDEGTGEESCVGILNNFYGDGVKWHDVACHHQKPWVCEDSEELLNYARSISRRRIP